MLNEKQQDMFVFMGKKLWKKSAQEVLFFQWID